MQFSGRILAGRSEGPCRNSVTENEYKLRCYVRADNLAGVCVTDQVNNEKTSCEDINR